LHCMHAAAQNMRVSRGCFRSCPSTYDSRCGYMY
jgi:hypothetical protein